MTVVDARRYSRNSGATSADSETGTPGSSSARMAPIRCSCAGLTYECSRQTATDSTSSRRSSAAASRTDASSSATSTSPGRAEPLADPDGPVARHERLRLLEPGVVERRPHLPRDLEQVAETLGRDEAAARDLALDDRVRRDRRRVDDEADVGGANAALGERALDRSHEPVRRVGRRGQHLRDRDAARLLVDEGGVGERAADVDRDADGRESGRRGHARNASVAASSTRRSAIATR